MWGFVARGRCWDRNACEPLHCLGLNYHQQRSWDIDVRVLHHHKALAAALPPALPHRYGLVGRNGTGKTTLLRHLNQKAIKGIPDNAQILHVEQEVRACLFVI